MKEYTVYDDEEVCKHSYTEQCHETYKTSYKPDQKEECEEEFIKNCYIQFKDNIENQRVTKCSQQNVCTGEGPKVCRQSNDIVCETRYDIHSVNDDVAQCKTELEKRCEDIVKGYETSKECTNWPKIVCTLKNVAINKSTPNTKCKSVPREVCGPVGCNLETLEEVCVEEIDTIVIPVSYSHMKFSKN